MMEMEDINNLKILIIDDNPDIHQDFIKILTESKINNELQSLQDTIFGNENKRHKVSFPNFQIDTVLQGKEGVDKIKMAINEGSPYSLAFVDIRMPPGWDGITTIKHIWEVDPNIQIVICTAYSDYTWEQTIEQLGETDNLLILKKPFDYTAVRQLAFALTKKWQLSREILKNTELLKNRIKERTEELDVALSEVNTTLEAALDGILITNHKDEVVLYNHAFVQQWNFPNSVLNSQKTSILIEYILSKISNPQEFLDKLNSLKNNETQVSIDVLKMEESGKVFECYSQPYMFEQNIIGRVFSFRDITQRIVLERQLEYQATHDVLTDLPNRVLLHDRLHQLILQANRENASFAILYLDLDRFKLINDSYDHSVGDQLLKMVAERLTSTVRKMDTVARVGGDEFVVVFPKVSFDNSVIVLANKILSKLREPYPLMHRDIVCLASIGVCMYPRDGGTIDELIRNADLAMYRSKEFGGDQFQFYSPILNERSIHRIEMENEIRAAMAKNEFFLNYQPEFDAETGSIIAAEALVRWNHPVKGVIPPLDFIPFAEETGLIIQLGEWVLRTACHQTMEWHKAGFEKLQIAVNVSTDQFRYRNFSDIVAKVLQETGLPPEYLMIEITENTIIKSQDAIDGIYDLKKLGVKIALDDFGTGSSSLNYLRTIPIDHVKIDKSFVKNISVNRNDEILIQAIIQMADNLNLKVIAEGVETQSQLDFLKKSRKIELQGFYFAKPMGVNEFEKFIKDYQPKLKLCR